MYENEHIRGIPMSRYVASWANAGGTFKRFRNRENAKHRRTETYFADWLRSLTINGEHLTEEEVRKIDNYATNGKFEFESLAKKFLKEHGLE
jgi:hypothetical protein